MHTVTFYPLGNADCTRIELDNGKAILFDYANMRSPNDAADKRCDLPKLLLDRLAATGKDYFDVVAFTHIDNDHVCGASDFFHLDYASEYQGDERIKIRELWVPAAAVTEVGVEDDARSIRAEARFRFKNGYGIKVFSRPDHLQAWAESENIDLETRRHLIVDAGTTVPGLDLATDGVEVFVHSPFAERTEAGVVDRNDDSIAVQATFQVGATLTRLLLMSDLGYEAIEGVVRVTRYHGNEIRLAHDIAKLPHHCSYKSLSFDKGQTETEPTDSVRWIWEDQAQTATVLVSTSKPIPDDDRDVQPPHRQAAKFYERCAKRVSGQFKVTMETPTRYSPDPLVIEIGRWGGNIQKRPSIGAAAVFSTPAPRSG
jgi:plastocyanin